ncbi:MAG: sulfatase [Bryobacteraceae bacterium]|nr:sulfatase [Bryobacteraceae bacterium]
MNRRNFLGSLAAPLAAQGAKRPNILYIMSDDHASHAISAYGSKINKTPNIDRIAQSGARLDNCFVTNSICCPSRAVILTGQYSHLNGVKTLNDRIDPARPHVAKTLQAGGYQTAMIGKWHLGTDPAGFDYWNILPGQGLYQNPELIEMGKRQKHSGYATDVITDFSLDWLKKRDASKPFFLMCHHKAPHREWSPAERHKKLFENDTIPEPDNLFDDYRGRSGAAERSRMRVGEDMTKQDLKLDPPPGLSGMALRKWGYQVYMKDYLRCVQAVDENVGRMLDYLEESGQAQNTIVVYTSDQGFFLGDHGWFDKRFMYEESLRMPFLVRWPGVVKPGTVNRDMTLNLDFAPTFLDWAGMPASPEMQGRSMTANLRGRTPRDWRTEMYYRYWMHLGGGHSVTAHYGIRTMRHKLMYFYGKALGSSGAVNQDTPPEWEFYDLQADPREMKNAYAEPKYAKTVADLKVRLAALQKQFKDEPA